MAGTEATPRKVGSRWYDARPEGEELAKWFVDDVPLHEGLDPTRYISGVTLIQQTERRKVTRFTDAGQPFQADVDELVFTPYAKVETRVLYWHDYLAVREGDLVGAIEPGPVGHVSQEGLYSMHLPEGFFVQAARDKDGKVALYLCCTRIAKIVLAETAEIGHDGRLKGKPIMLAAPGTKAVPLLGRYGPDDTALMKAETGAVGRALGFAGMLVIPGTGVATAEDVLEATRAEDGNASSVAEPDVKLPATSSLESQLSEVVSQLKEHKDGYKEFTDWLGTKNLPADVAKIPSSSWRGVLRQAERRLKEAQEVAA